MWKSGAFAPRADNPAIGHLCADSASVPCLASPGGSLCASLSGRPTGWLLSHYLLSPELRGVARNVFRRRRTTKDEGQAYPHINRNYGAPDAPPFLPRPLLAPRRPRETGERCRSKLCFYIAIPPEEWALSVVAPKARYIIIRSFPYTTARANENPSVEICMVYSNPGHIKMCPTGDGEKQ